MGVRMSFDFYGDTQLERTLTRFTRNADDATPAWEKIADSFAQLEAKQFSSQGAHASGGWAPLSPKYAAWKAQRYPGQPTLVRTGELRASLIGRPFGVEVITPQSITIGSNVEHGQYHQHGTSRMPQRRPVELTESARREWVKILQKHIVSDGGL